MMMRIGTVASSITVSASLAAISAITLSAPSVDALTITASGTDYDVIVEETTFQELFLREDFDTLVPWFGDESLAEEIAIAAGEAHYSGREGELGRPHRGGFIGPLFAFDLTNDDGTVLWKTYQGGSLQSDGTVDLEQQGALNVDADEIDGDKVLYVIVDPAAAAIPTPALLPGLLSVGLAAIRKRNLMESDEI